MNKQHVTTMIIVAVIVGAAGFWGGMTYAQSKTPAAGAARAGQFGGVGGRGNRFTNGSAFGFIIAKDATSITVQLGGPNASSTNGTATGSKIVLYSGSTEIGKTVAGAISDLNVGENVVVNGTPNADGSITAQTIQIRPAGMAGPGGGRPQGGQ